MVANPSKFQLIYPGTFNINLSLFIEKTKITSVDVVKLLGIKIDSKLSFIPHVTEICKKSNQKLRALRRVRNFLSDEQTKLLINAYILSPFNYCPLVWMFCGKGGSNLIEKCHHRALCALKNEPIMDYNALLSDCNTVDIHARNLKLLLTEVFKSTHGLGPRIMHGIFTVLQSRYKLRSGQNLTLPLYKKYNSAFGVNTFDFRAVSSWNNLPSTIKSQDNLESFVKALDKISPKCTCKICT